MSSRVYVVSRFLKSNTACNCERLKTPFGSAKCGGRRAEWGGGSAEGIFPTKTGKKRDGLAATDANSSSDNFNVLTVYNSCPRSAINVSMRETTSLTVPGKL